MNSLCPAADAQAVPCGTAPGAARRSMMEGLPGKKNMADATSRNILTADWDWVIRAARDRYLLHGPSRPAPVAVIPCEIVLTFRRGTNGKILNVRCRCQAQTRRLPRERFYGYDRIGSSDSLAGAVALWRAWHEERGVPL